MSIFVGVATIVLVIALAVVSIMRSNIKDVEGSRKIKSIQLTVIIALVVMIITSAFTFIPDGYIGRGKTMGVFNGKEYQRGVVVHLPIFQGVQRLPVKLLTRELADNYVAAAKSLDDIEFKGSFFRVQYRLREETIEELYIQYGNNLEEEVIQFPMIKAAFTAVARTLTATEIGAGGEDAINEPARAALQDIVDRTYGAGRVEVVALYVGEVQADALWQEYASNVERTRKELEASSLENNRLKAIADNENVILLDRAKAEAERRVIEANAIAEANDKISESITQEIIDDKYAEATKLHGWYIAGKDSSVIVNGETYKERIPTT